MKFHEYKIRYPLEGVPNKKLGIVAPGSWHGATARMYMNGKLIGVVTGLRIADKTPILIRHITEEPAPLVQ